MDQGLIQNCKGESPAVIQGDEDDDPDEDGASLTTQLTPGPRRSRSNKGRRHEQDAHDHTRYEDHVQRQHEASVYPAAIESPVTPPTPKSIYQHEEVSNLQGVPSLRANRNGIEQESMELEGTRALVEAKLLNLKKELHVTNRDIEKAFGFAPH